MSKSVFIVFVTIIISLIIIIAALAIKYLPISSVYLGTKPGNNNTKDQQVNIYESSNQVTLPIDINSADVYAATLNYVFEANITALNHRDPSVGIITDIKTPGVPNFIVAPDTEVFYFDEKVSKKAAAEDLRVGQRVRIISLYGLKKKRWITSRVNILVPSVSALPASDQ